MFIKISLLRPQRGDNFLTYRVPEIFKNEVKKGDIVEIPMRNTREQGVVFSVFSEPPEFETKMMGNIIQKEFFKNTFLDFISEISRFFFCSPSFFLSKTAPLDFFTHTALPPQEKIYITKNIPEISGNSKPPIIGKKQQELCKLFLSDSGNSHSCFSIKIKASELRKQFSSTTIKTALQKNYIEEIFQEKYPENSLQNPEKKQEKYKNKFYPLSTLELHSKKNIIIGSNHSAKNAVLAQWIQEKINNDEQVVFIFPDLISLYQAYLKFQKIFPSEQTSKKQSIVELYSSGTTKKNKEELFFKLKSGHTKILLATKNALFFQYKKLGGIIMHEYHNDLYITHNFPFTHAKDIAQKRAEIENIDLIFEASTGDIEEIYKISENSSSKKPENSGKLLEFTGNNTQHKEDSQNSIQIVDMNLERLNNNHSSLSYSLEVFLQENLEKQQQSLLFLNRKGMFTSLFCSECKWTPISPLSGQRLGVFKNTAGKKILRCTASKYHEEFPHLCPQCKKNTLIELGKGTQEVEEFLVKKFIKKFPQARIFRADKDSLSSPLKVRNFVQDMQSGDIDIVIGTQIIAQAYPFENVSLVANIMTENDILFPSFKAEEKGFLKNQKFLDIVGARFPSKKILQTFCPQHPFIKKVQENNFQNFFYSEISERKSLQYPPFSTSIEISKNAKTKTSLEKSFLEIQSEIYKLCEHTFPIQISYHPQRQIFTAKMLIFTKKALTIWNLLQKKGVTLNRYSE